jgi:DNA-binding CsgD family transcriptional regulator
MARKHMTKRRREIARRLALGQSAQDVARELGVQPHTIHKLLSHLCQETGAYSQAGLMGWCVAHGIISIPELQEVYCHG